MHATCPLRQSAPHTWPTLSLATLDGSTLRQHLVIFNDSSCAMQAMQSGVEHALDVLALGLSLDGAAELQASPAQWAQLCEEIR
eukprot:245264-Amphidinium_carterae.1